MNKTTVHNELEARVLIKEAFSRGDEEKYQVCQFYTHLNVFLFTAHIDLISFTRDYSHDGIVRDSITEEL